MRFKIIDDHKSELNQEDTAAHKTQLAFYVNLHRPDIDLRRMLTGKLRLSTEHNMITP